MKHSNREHSLRVAAVIAVLFGLLLIACYLIDRKLYPSAGLQHWLTLRFHLSTVAALSCFLAAGAL